MIPRIIIEDLIGKSFIFSFCLNDLHSRFHLLKKDAPVDREHPLLQILPPQMRPLRIRTLSVSCFVGHDNQVRNGA